jgi:hypothetical protein
MYKQNSKNLLLSEYEFAAAAAAAAMALEPISSLSLLYEYEFDVSEINRDVSEAPAYAFNNDILTVQISCRGTKSEDHDGLDEIIWHL